MSTRKIPCTTTTPTTTALTIGSLLIAAVAFATIAEAAPFDPDATLKLSDASASLSDPAATGAAKTTTVAGEKAFADAPELMRLGAPPAPIPLLPEDPIALGAPEVGFQWRDGDGAVRAEFFRVCVYEAGSRCGASGVVYPDATSTALSETYFRPEGGLPLELQGKLLHWKVLACAYDLSSPYLGAFGPLEICTPSATRSIDWRRPAATLLPVEGTSASQSRLRFHWDFGPNTDTDHLLVCFAEPGFDCTSRYAHVVRLDDPTTRSGLVTDDTWEQLEGRRVAWSVALCDATGDCSWSEPAEYTFEYRPKSFGRLLPAVRHASCENCHTFRAGNVVYDRHIAQRRFGEYDDQSDAQTCAGCHHPGTGFPTGWRAPAGFRFGTRPLDCKEIRADLLEARRNSGSEQYGSSVPDPALAHLRDDDLIEWAIDRNPDVSQLEWDALASRWISGGMTCEQEHNDTFSGRRQKRTWLFDLFTKPSGP